jgi:Protein of unknown function (DUF3631)
MSTQLADLVKPFKIKPNAVRRDEKTAKGYMRAWFEDAFARYLPPRSVTTSQPSDSAGFGPPRSVTLAVSVTRDVTGADAGSDEGTD